MDYTLHITQEDKQATITFNFELLDTYFTDEGIRKSLLGDETDTEVEFALMLAGAIKESTLDIDDGENTQNLVDLGRENRAKVLLHIWGENEDLYSTCIDKVYAYGKSLRDNLDNSGDTGKGDVKKALLEAIERSKENK